MIEFHFVSRIQFGSLLLRKIFVMPIPNPLLVDIPIIQKVFGPEDSLMVNKILNDLSGSQQYTSESPYHFIVYIDGENPSPIIWIQGSKKLLEYEKRVPTFKESLLQLTQFDFDTILFLTTLYGAYGKMDPLYLMKSSNKLSSIPNVDDFLKNSFGYLLYSHQFEQLVCMLTGMSYNEAILFRKDWNKKKVSVRLATKEILVTDKIMLHQLISERTVEENQFVFNANFRGAYVLWNYINSRLLK